MIFQVMYNNFAETFTFPINPPEYRVSPDGKEFTDINVTNGGKVTIPGNDELKEVAFSSYFPLRYDASLCAVKKIIKPWAAVALIEKWKKSGLPVRLVISGTKINMPCTIRTFNYSEQGGAVGDIDFDISFKKYTFVNIREVVKKKPATATTTTKATTESASSRPDLTQTPKTHIVKKGNTLWGISKKYYGKGSEYMRIYNANKKVIGSNPNIIKPGQKLIIPERK